MITSFVAINWISANCLAEVICLASSLSLPNSLPARSSINRTSQVVYLVVGPGVDISYALVYLKRCRNRFLPAYFDTVATEQDTAKDNQKEKSWYAYTQEKAGESVYWCVLHDVPFF
ncbi:MAG: hypothetical protein IPI39_25535 [Candidatus Obscuribacter sp.]|nr:hypothetical protein [Candidatus Obscuribacter sp.]